MFRLLLMIVYKLVVWVEVAVFAIDHRSVVSGWIYAPGADNNAVPGVNLLRFR